MSVQRDIRAVVSSKAGAVVESYRLGEPINLLVAHIRLPRRFKPLKSVAAGQITIDRGTLPFTWIEAKIIEGLPWRNLRSHDYPALSKQQIDGIMQLEKLINDRLNQHNQHNSDQFRSDPMIHLVWCVALINASGRSSKALGTGCPKSLVDLTTRRGLCVRSIYRQRAVHLR